MLINKNNFYIEYNYKNILPFNLKKKVLRVHANLIGIKKLRSFLLENENKQQYVKSWYHYFGINNLKRSNTLLAKKFLNKKLSVFFISNFNMVESKWILPIVYQEYYEQYMYKKKKKIDLFRNKSIFFFNYKFYFSNLFIKKISLINNLNFRSLYYLKYINIFNKKISLLNYNYNIFQQNYFLSLKSNLKTSIFLIRNIRKQRNLKQAEYLNNKRKIFFNKKEIGGYNFDGFFSKLKKKNEIKNLIKNIYIKNIIYLKNLNLKWKKGLKLLLREYKLSIFKAKNFKERFNKFINQKLNKKIEKLNSLYNFLIKKKAELIKHKKFLKNKLNNMANKEFLKNFFFKNLFKKNKNKKITEKQKKEEEKINILKVQCEKLDKKILNFLYYYKNTTKQIHDNLQKLKIIKKRLIYLNDKNKNKDIKKIKNKLIYLKKLIYNMLFISQKKKFSFKQNKIIKFFVLKKILIKLQLLKLLNEIKKNTNNKFFLWFYKIFIIFKYLSVIKKNKKIKKTYNNFWVNNLKQKINISILKINNKSIKSKNLWKIEKLNSEKIKLNFFIEKIYKKLNINIYLKLYLNYFNKLKKNLNIFYKNKFVKNNKFKKKFVILKKQGIFYKFINSLQKNLNYSKLKQLNMLKEKWNKKLSTNLNIKYWLKKNKKAITIIKKIYKYLDFNKNIIKLSLSKNNKNILLFNNFKNFKDYSLLNYNILWKRRKDLRVTNFKLYKNIRLDNEYLYSSFLKKINKKNFSILKNNNKRNYSIYHYFLKYDEGFLYKNINLNEIKNKINYKKNYLKNINILNNSKDVKNKYYAEKQYKKNYRLKKENKLIINLFKEFILGIYEEKSYYIFYKYLGTFKKEIPLNYTLKLTKTMKIKGDLWTAPCIIHYYDPVLIELRTLKMRINNFWMVEKKHLKWKGHSTRFLSYKKKKKNSSYKQLNNEWKLNLKKIKKKYDKKEKKKFIDNFINQINELKQSIINVNAFRNIKTVNFYLKNTILNINHIDLLKKNNIKKLTEKNLKQVKIKFELKSNQEKEIFYYLFLNNLLKKNIKINNKILYRIKLIELKEKLKINKIPPQLIVIKDEDDEEKKKVKINKYDLNKYIIIKIYLKSIKSILKKKRKIKSLNNNLIVFFFSKKKRKLLKNINKYRKIKNILKLLRLIILLKKNKLRILKRKKLRNLNKKYIKNFKNIEHAIKILNLVQARKDNLNKRISMKLFLWNILKFKKEKKMLEKKKRKIIKIIKKKNMYNNIILKDYIIKYWYRKNLLLYIIINYIFKDFYKIGSALKYKYNFVKSKYYLNWILWLKLWNYKRFKYINKKKKIRRINYINILNNIYKF